MDPTTITRETLQADRRDSAGLPPQERVERNSARKAALRTLPREQQRALQQQAQTDCEAARARIAAAIVLPTLTGDPEQTAGADRLRRGALDNLLARLVIASFDATVKYGLYSPDYVNPLAIDDPRTEPITVEDEYPDETTLVEALNALLASPERITAGFWIEHRGPGGFAEPSGSDFARPPDSSWMSNRPY